MGAFDMFVQVLNVTGLTFYEYTSFLPPELVCALTLMFSLTLCVYIARDFLRERAHKRRIALHARNKEY